MEYDDKKDELVFKYEREARHCAGFINSLSSLENPLVKVELSCYDDWIVTKVKAN